MPCNLYSFYRFKALPKDVQLDELNRHGVELDLSCTVATAEAVLFAYNGFYVELLVQKHTDEILNLTCFKSMKKLEPYLSQVDISDVLHLCG